MRSKNILFIFLLVLLCVNFVSAFEYDITEINYLTNDGYEGGDGEFEAIIIASEDNICTIICTWETVYGPENIGTPEQLSPGEPKPFHFKVRLEGDEGHGSDNLVITCEKYSGCLWGNDETNFEGEVNFEFDWNGDKECQYDNDVNPEDCFSAKTDCICSSGTKCKEDLTRTQDSMGCTTYCGNGICEEKYESCLGSSSLGCSDCKICDGFSCDYDSECAGGYCVHEVCASTPWVKNDNNCDSDVGENCDNSYDDCVCDSHQECNPNSKRDDLDYKGCVTYCGNGQCEESEKGICKVDCDWCGDGECNNNENCNSCENDCGVCENEESNTEIIESAKEAVEAKISEAKTNQSYVLLGGIGLIVLVVVIYFIVKFTKLKKSKNQKITKKKYKKANGKKTTKKKTTKKKSKK